MPMTISGQRGASGVAACASVLEDFLAFDDDIAGPLDGDLRPVDRDIAALLHVDAGRAAGEGDLVADVDRERLADADRAALAHAFGIILADAQRAGPADRHRLILTHRFAAVAADRDRLVLADTFPAVAADGNRLVLGDLFRPVAVDGDGLVLLHRLGPVGADGDRLVVVDRLCAVVPHMRRLVVDDVFLAVVAHLLRLVVLDDEVAVLLCVDVDLLVALLVLEADLVGAATALARIALDGRFRLLGGQWVRRLVRAIVDAAGDDGTVGIALEEIDDHLHADAGNEHRAPTLRRPSLTHADPARAVLILLSVVVQFLRAVPMEANLDAAVFVGIDFVAARADDERGLRAVNDRQRRHARRTKLLCA